MIVDDRRRAGNLSIIALPRLIRDAEVEMNKTKYRTRTWTCSGAKQTFTMPKKIMMSLLQVRRLKLGWFKAIMNSRECLLLFFFLNWYDSHPNTERKRTLHFYIICSVLFVSWSELNWCPPVSFSQLEQNLLPVSMWVGRSNSKPFHVLST